jgi:Icc-related predicted phosphoesterase
MGTGLQSQDGGRARPVARLAAVGDLHVGRDSATALEAELLPVVEEADLLLIAGDLTQHGHREEGRALAEVLAKLTIPRIAVLGNHDYQNAEELLIRADLEEAGVIVLEGESTIVVVSGHKIGIGGSKGFGGGFAGACGTEFGEPEMKAFIRHTKYIASRFADCLMRLDCDLRVAMTHYAPINGTLQGERLEIYPFLGSYMLAEAIDRSRCDLAVHGHAHRGTERGVTPGGVPVRNVARPVIRQAYKIYDLSPSMLHATPAEARGSEEKMTVSAG